MSVSKSQEVRGAACAAVVAGHLGPPGLWALSLAELLRPDHGDLPRPPLQQHPSLQIVIEGRANGALLGSIAMSLFLVSAAG